MIPDCDNKIKFYKKVSDTPHSFQNKILKFTNKILVSGRNTYKCIHCTNTKQIEWFLFVCLFQVISETAEPI